MHFWLLETRWRNAVIFPGWYTWVWRHDPRGTTPEVEKELSKEFTVTGAGHQVGLQHRVKVVAVKDINDSEGPIGIDNPTRCHPEAISTQEITELQELLSND